MGKKTETEEPVITNEDLIAAGQNGYVNGLKEAITLLKEMDGGRQAEPFLATLRLQEFIDKAISSQGEPQ